jgi:hypothetical protein
MTNEKVGYSREAMIKFLKIEGVYVIGTTEEFSGQEGGIWVGGEENDGLLEYYNNNSSKFTLGVDKKLKEAVKKRGWWFEWNDPGTMMVWPNN